MKNIQFLGDVIAATVKAYGEASDRSQQSAQGIIGPSDLGFCRQKAVLMTKGVPQSDSTSIAAAQIGTAIHAYVAEALKALADSTWIVDNRKVTATFPSGMSVSGTPDLICPDYNAIVDTKTVDGFEWVKREGTSQAHKYQRHTYALGAIQEKLLDDSKPVYVANLYIDRSGKQPEPYFVWEEFDPTLTDEIDGWITDVVYAVTNNEDASRDLPSAVCERICSYFTACRGGLEVHEGGEIIVDTETVSAIDMYVEAREMSKQADQMKKEASSRLYGINGATDRWQVRWVEVQPTRVESFDKQGYSRLDIRKVRAR